MSTGEGRGVVLTPLCQGFLKKRKDKMRLRWVTYWFKLHNTTLFFYTKKNGSASDLRGQYYLFEVESVHEVMRTENKRYLFELTMKNGKRKVLAADTADLRQEWICQLLKAMKHPGPNTPALTPNWHVSSDSKRRAHSSPCNSSNSSCIRSNSEISVGRPYSTITYHCTSSVNPQPLKQYLTLHTSTALGLADTKSTWYPEDELEQNTEKIQPESDYDILPARKSLNYEEAIYDTPPSNRRASGRDHEMTDSIYDVPKSIFRRNDGEERPMSGTLLIDMMACLGEDSADWVRAAAPSAICKP
ncbi:uncharacterized protein LOC118805682 [Colossoma macropomum]|uniref:uncharacterized protein LOC118805682 n=1 Tax=Colossoma macropomum TaxID=42526 RepID=UPI001864C511|nr:uncharacterized protein LOC118805682 [Colossoma macropomum]